MSPAKTDGPGHRDEALARALVEALRSAAASADAPGGASCADAELLAAYADRGLGADEAERWEHHFAGCARCQSVLAVLAASSEPLAEGEVARLGHLAAGVELPAKTVRATPPSLSAVLPAAIARPAAAPSVRRLSSWRWLAPAAGVAAVLALWLAFHPGRSGEPTTLTAEKIEPASNPSPTVIAPQAPSTANAPPAAAARDEAPASNNSNSPAPEQRALREEELKPEEKSKPGEPIPPAELQDRAASVQQNATSGAPEPAAKETSPPSAAQRGAGAVPRASAAEADGAVATAAPPAAAAAVQPLNGGLAPKAQSDIRALSVQAQKQPVDALASARMATFAAPDGAVSWRVGAAGRLERSADQGRTWQPQSSGVTADLLAGAAVSDGVAWAVGRGGAILRTTDGEHWQRVALPRDFAAGSPPDWTGVDARDARHATITSKDLRRFVTADGGRTWTAQ